MAERIHEFPGCDKFSVRGHTFEIDAVEASTAFQEILAGMGESGTQKEYLQKINAWVQEHGGPDLSQGEAEWFYQYVAVLREEKRDFFREKRGGKLT